MAFPRLNLANFLWGRKPLDPLVSVPTPYLKYLPTRLNDHACRKSSYTCATTKRNFSRPNRKIILQVASKKLYKKLRMIITMIKRLNDTN
jgi:transposase-like protein